MLKFPYDDPRKPMLVHVLTSLRAFGDGGDRDLLTLITKRAVIIPGAERWRRRRRRMRSLWEQYAANRPRRDFSEGRYNNINDIDIAAGDDGFAFYSVGGLFSGSAGNHPAVAYDLKTVCARITHRDDIGFRPHDIQAAYLAFVRAAGECNDDGGSAPDEDGVDNWTQYDCHTEDLVAIASYGTAFGPDRVMKLSRLHLAALHRRNTMPAAMAIVNPQKRYDDFLGGGDDDFDPLGKYRTDAATVEIDWTQPFRPSVAKAGKPEILLRRALRVRDAEWFFLGDAHGGWVHRSALVGR